MAAEQSRNPLRLVWLFRVACMVVGVGCTIGLIFLHLQIEERFHRQSVDHAGRFLTRFVKRDLEDVIAREPEFLGMASVADKLRRRIDVLRNLGEIANVLVVDRERNTVVVLDAATESDMIQRLRSSGVMNGESPSGVVEEARSDGDEAHQFMMIPLLRAGHLVGAVVIQKRLGEEYENLAIIQAEVTVAVVSTMAIMYLFLGVMIYLSEREASARDREAVQREKSLAVGALAAAVAHEIRNPLNTLSLTCQDLRSVLRHGQGETAADEEVERDFDVMSQEITRLQRIIDDFVRLARDPELQRDYTDLHAVLQRSLDLFAQELKERQVRLDRRLAGDAPAWVDADRLSQVFANLIKNAIDAMSEGGRLTVEGESTGRNYVLRFSDTGCGMTRQALSRAFEPYFTTKETGMGLGLAVSRRIVESHGGRIEAHSREDRGTTIVIELPMANESIEG